MSYSSLAEIGHTMGGIRGAVSVPPPPAPVRINWDELGLVCQLEKEAEVGV